MGIESETFNVLCQVSSQHSFVRIFLLLLIYLVHFPLKLGFKSFKVRQNWFETRLDIPSKLADIFKFVVRSFFHFIRVHLQDGFRCVVLYTLHYFCNTKWVICFGNLCCSRLDIGGLSRDVKLLLILFDHNTMNFSYLTQILILEINDV